MSRHHPRNRKERLAFKSRLGNKITSTREKVVKRVNVRGTKAKLEKIHKWKKWNPATD